MIHIFKDTRVILKIFRNQNDFNILISRFPNDYGILKDEVIIFWNKLW